MSLSKIIFESNALFSRALYRGQSMVDALLALLIGSSV